MSHRTSADEEEVSRSIAPDARNDAAWEDPSRHTEGSRSSTSDSKRRNAAQLAQELGSSSPWSQAVMPQAQIHDTPFGRDPTTSRIRTEELDNVHSNTMAQSPQELDPPPAYSNLSHVHELPASPVTMPRRNAAAADTQGVVTQDTGIDLSEDLEEQEQDDRTPLLGGVERRWNQRGWNRWIHSAKTTRQRHCRLLALVIAFSFLTSLVVCAFVGVFQGEAGTWSPSIPFMPFVPTGPEYERHEMFENIHAAYKLHDRLDLSTTTGAIDIEIDPQPGDQPAILILSSQTGSITLRLSSAYLHRRHKAARAIHTEIRSLTGSVTAEILLGHGSFALVDTGTGTQILSILASGMGRHDEISNLTTYSKTGAQRVTLTSLGPTSDSLTNLRAEHHSFATASLDITYPAVWSGKVRAAAFLSNHLSVKGKDLEYVKQDDLELVAYRGPVKGRQTVEVISDGTGDLSFKC
ncbi:hypothetical protein PMZ80_008679 [Knufia obscura]|uniref:Peptidase A2 domain-containing protein n=1 Tax=Knufia obscura TaxID=1635080 RepID=A0ABR0RFJ6_9EURO|nr:hypothetical protein PMZ80_008679 [Knufia obscura]